MPRGLLDRLAGFADRGLACDHLGDVEPRAVPAHERAERHVGNAGHRRQHDGAVDPNGADLDGSERSEEHTSELQSLMRRSYAVFCLKKKKLHSVKLDDM